MRSYVQPGNTLTLVAPYAVASGAGALVGSIFGVANGAVANGAEGEFDVVGVFDLAKAGTQAWTQGVKVYWDNTAKVTTNVATANTLTGVAVAAVAGGAGDIVGRVRLNGAL